MIFPCFFQNGCCPSLTPVTRRDWKWKYWVIGVYPGTTPTVHCAYAYVAHCNTSFSFGCFILQIHLVSCGLLTFSRRTGNIAGITSSFFLLGELQQEVFFILEVENFCSKCIAVVQVGNTVRLPSVQWIEIFWIKGLNSLPWPWPYLNSPLSA